MMPSSMARPATPEPASAIRRSVVSRFNIAFSLMSIIPMLTCCYLITVRFVSMSAFQGLNGIYLLLAIVIALLGLLTGQQLIRDIIRRLIAANA